MAAPPRRKSLKLRLELREGELDSGKRVDAGAAGMVEDAGGERESVGGGGGGEG